jgi:hypothetical protein
MFVEFSPPSNAKHCVHQAFGKGIELEDTIATLDILTTHFFQIAKASDFSLPKVLRMT